VNPPAALSALPPPPRRTVGQRVWRIWDQVSIYLPVLLMGVLALGSYWLLRLTPQPEPAAVQTPVGSDPDYYMRRFSVKVFNADGSLRTEVFGAEARHYPDTGRMEIDTARIRSYSEARQLTVATAKRITSNAEHTEFTLEGNAVVVRQAGRNAAGKATPRMEFHGEYLKVYTPRDSVFSDRPVEIIRGSDRITADQLLYRGDRQAAALSGRVRMQLQPRKP
jgi:lipopolysaccharide export system protein LptC